MTTAKENMCSSEKKERKKKKTRNRGPHATWVALSLGRAGAWVCAAWCCISISSSSLSFFSFLSFFVSAFWVINNNNYFLLEIESQRLDFHVDATWKKCHIRREQPIKIESQKLDLWTLNRVSQTRIARKKYSLETRTTKYIVRILWLFGHFSQLPNQQYSSSTCSSLIRCKEGGFLSYVGQQKVPKVPTWSIPWPLKQKLSPHQLLLFFSIKNIPKLINQQFKNGDKIVNWKKKVSYYFFFIVKNTPT